MALPQIPSEIILDVAKCLEYESDINAFARVNIRLYNIVNCYLYKYNVDHQGSSALSWAAVHGQQATARKSLAEGANVQVQCQSETNLTPLPLAAWNGHDAVIQLLLATEGIEPDFRNPNGVTPLAFAAWNGHEAVVKLLLATRVEPDSKTSSGDTPLLLAVWNGHEAVAKLLLVVDGVDPESRTSRGETPLLLAASNGHEALVKLLLATDGVNPNAQTPSGDTPLILAV
ncbi:hypothetical protein PMG11_03195 [Penicillium brasilianum]|uniref:Uncharacterized protein n=1 Tax=Penicillium brasilianum TaxID=104259 RepID=A0A0F7VCV2_PENBI|nr:hypothetical protein PMG11_03195 [Penicillium brasilianum]